MLTTLITPISLKTEAKNTNKPINVHNVIMYAHFHQQQKEKHKQQQFRYATSRN
jgi:hypothetical protein